ncbi:MAG: hypothetical protein PG981_001187 [Wolbachia endosymbiont of Ctenocephalides orientis wCori]|nr:MAG: hypothetical protein PG981_001187 [Wolbachia endosymbiont of Ctenocephalides orientis wCori]
MRLKQDDNIYLFNGRDGEWIGEISGISHKSVRVTLKECIRKQESEGNLYLYCAIVKNTALSNIIRQATEMGVTCIQFILTEHTVAKSINLERAKLQSIEAAEQCGRISNQKFFRPLIFLIYKIIRIKILFYVMKQVKVKLLLRY